MNTQILILFFVLLSCIGFASADEVLIAERVHLRSGDQLEWDEFSSSKKPAKVLEHSFKSKSNKVNWCLVLRQYDVKEAWKVQLNGKRLGNLHRDENDMLTVLEIPSGLLKPENTLKVSSTSKRGSDDIRVGPIELLTQSRQTYLSQATLQLTVTDQFGTAVPSRITLVNEDGTLPSIGTKSSQTMAIRPGTVYLSPEGGKITVPAGRYTIYAGRGFEYSLAKSQLNTRQGATTPIKLVVRREVDTRGWVACDTHVHSLTHSGHGDATVNERMLTLAGEGIELPIATDHNVHVDHDPFARAMKVRRYFTPVIGNEVTTKTGHFNVFPVYGKPKPPAFQSMKWDETLKGIFATPKIKVAILNHARDVHSGVRPFGPMLFNEVAGQLYNGRGKNLRRLASQRTADLNQPRVNAMEILNSSATQSDVMELTRDWMSVLNGGHHITPVGSSDSHDVARHFVGQGRTYIRCDDRDPGNISIDEAVASFLAGRVCVSYGLMTTIQVEGKQAGELVSTSGKDVKVEVRVLGPSWTRTSKITLYQNGIPIRDELIKKSGREAGIHWQWTFTIPKPKHDVFLVAVAVGPGVEQSYWKMAKPYQPTSTKWASRSLGVSGALWLDTDNDRKRTSARGYARRVLASTKGQLAPAIGKLTHYDDAIAAQVADLFESSDDTLFTDANQAVLQQADERIQLIFRRYLDAVRASLKR